MQMYTKVCIMYFSFHREAVDINMQRCRQRYVSCCISHQRVEAERRGLHGELHPLDILGRRWESVSMDLITDLPQIKKGYDAICVFVDR
jgi:hypothetical protein